MESSENQRLKTFLESLRLTTTEFARVIETSQPAVSAIVSGKRAISKGMEARISDAYPQLNMDWLKTGKGEMIQSTATRSVNSVSDGGMATLGDLSPIFKDIKLEIEECFEDNTGDTKAMQARIKKLYKQVAQLENEVANLQGKISAKDEVIKMLLGK